MTQVRSPSLLAIGPFPPPVHGQSLATEHLVEGFATAGISVLRVDVSGSLGGKLIAHLLALFRVLAGRGPCYISLNSNSGIWLSLALLAVARIRGRPTLLHYHSYALVRRRSVAVALLVQLSGKRSKHIVLGPRMAAALQEHYPHLAGRTLVLNNSGLIDPAGSPRRREMGPRLRLGFLGNLTLEKGIDTAVEVTRRLVDAGHSCTLIVAGPVSSPGAAEALQSARTSLGEHLIYRGAVYGLAKKEFFEEVDILLFPSRYRNEASPLVLMEAMANGIPAVATAVGCIPDDLADKGGRTVDNFVSEAPTVISAIGARLGHHSLQARQRFEELLGEHKVSVTALRQSLLAGLHCD